MLLSIVAHPTFYPVITTFSLAELLNNDYSIRMITSTAGCAPSLKHGKSCPMKSNKSNGLLAYFFLHHRIMTTIPPTFPPI